MLTGTQKEGEDDLQRAIQGLNFQADKSTGVLNATGDPIWSNPFVQDAIQLLDTLSDLGKALPFVAPAFIILKIIINIEKKAMDADAKCNDLLERITFMLGHLPILRRVQVMDATRQIIDRMNSALKTAASLIEAYRKQGAVARRLNISNKDKFTSCAQSINACCNDLMMSLQIHQTGQLDILTRSVPVDPEDEAAQTFVSSHGGVDAVKHDQELVTQFAHDLHLNMDDKVMEQINVNLTDLMQQNQAQLERILSDNVGTAVIDGIKGLATQMSEAEKEQRFKCVQCDQEYRNSMNTPTSCSFHSARYDSWIKSYPCCSTSHPCQFQFHHSRHHCKFPYSLFFDHSMGILNYVDTVDKWASVEDTDLKSNDVQKASIGRLLRWASRGQRISDPTILITVGTVWHSEKYFFDTFTTKALEAVADDIRMTCNTMIFRTSPSAAEFAMAEWVLSEGVVVGVRLTAKASTSESPYIRVCPIDIGTCSKSGDILAVSNGGFHSYKPEAPYILPETVRIGPELSDQPLRPTRTNFKTVTTPALPVVLKAISEPPLTANPEFASYDYDYFQGAVSVFNKHPAGSLKPITIASVSASFRLLGDETYVPVRSFEILDGVLLPITIDPRQAWSLKFILSVPRTKEDAKLQARWYNRAFVSRKRPLRLKLILEDIEGEECSLVLEHVFTPFAFDKLRPNDLASFYFDDPEHWERYIVRVAKGDEDKSVVSIVDAAGGISVDVLRLEQVVHRALETGETEINLDIGRERKGGVWEWEAWALIDLSCRRVYAFKIILKQGRLAPKKQFCCFGYVLCPDYGHILDESRPIRYAVETVKPPDLEPFPTQEMVSDDTVDDIIPEPPKPAFESLSTASSSTPSQMAISDDLSHRLASIDSSLSRIATSDDLNRRLASIDSSLSRIATAVEKLVIYSRK